MTTKTTQQLVDTANQAALAYQDVNQAYDRAVSDGEVLKSKMARLINGDTPDGTLGDLQELFCQNGTQGGLEKGLATKSRAARKAASQAYEEALGALARDAGLTDRFTPRAVSRVAVDDEPQMAGWAWRAEQDDQDDQDPG